MKKVNHTICPLCGDTHLAPVMECTDFFASGEVYTLVSCRACGFRFTQAVPDESEIGRYYESPAYISHSDTRQGLTDKLYHAVRRQMLKRKLRLVRRYSGLQAGSLLDYGTGTGYFAHTMQQAGWQVTAIEKSARARQAAFGKFGLQVGDEAAFRTLPDGSFQVITLWHVLEHLQDLHGMWEHFGRLLAADGCLVIAVPNCASADEAHYGNRWAAYDVPRHLWHFTPDTMQALAERHGFRLEVMLPMPFDAFYVSILSEKNSKASLPLLRGGWNGLRAWIKSCGHAGRSSSLIYVFRRG